MGKRKRSTKKIVTPGMKQKAQNDQIQEWAQQGIEIVKALQDPPKIQSHNEVLKRIRAAASLPFYTPVSQVSAVQFVSMAINAAYWLGKGANLGEEVFKQNGDQQAAD